MSEHRGEHCVYNLQYHIVLVTKYRRKCIRDGVEESVKREIGRLVESAGGSLVSIEADLDHVHFLAELPPMTCLSTFMRGLKGTSSRIIRRDHMPELQKYYKGENFSFWSDSFYIASAGGVTIDIIKKYVESQKTDAHKRKYTRRKPIHPTGK